MRWVFLIVLSALALLAGCDDPCDAGRYYNMKTACGEPVIIEPDNFDRAEPR